MDITTQDKVYGAIITALQAAGPVIPAYMLARRRPGIIGIFLAYIGGAACGIVAALLIYFLFVPDDEALARNILNGLMLPVLGIVGGRLNPKVPAVVKVDQKPSPWG